MVFDPDRIPDDGDDEQLAEAALWLLQRSGLDAAALTVDQAEEVVTLVAEMARYAPCSPAHLLGYFGHWYVQDVALEADGIAASAWHALACYHGGNRSWPATEPRARALARSRFRRPAGCRCVGLACACA